MTDSTPTFPSHRREVSRPAVEVPHGAWDTAAHVYGDPARFPFASGPKPFLPDPDSTMAELMRIHATLGIERGVLVQATSYGADHGLLREALALGEGRYVGVAVLSDDVSDDTARELTAAGVVGCRINLPGWLNTPPTDEQVLRRIERIRVLGWNVALHVDATVLVERAALLRSIDDVDVCIDHLGHFSASIEEDHPAWDVLDDLLSKENWWIRLSNADRGSDESTAYLDMVPIIRRFAEMAPGRSVWGTDWPHVFYKKDRMVDDGTLLDLLAEALDPATFHDVLVEAPRRLYRSAT
ncbi:amidohydrolase family protein [Nocardioides humi]|uniref:Amidohydrolase family protein n=1 Tax=Nocardioides humi TaxID=449461 RepID=A0ABN2A5X4_9ACTN|nr:amidohydrolase family protein [Nocardioides humi]